MTLVYSLAQVEHSVNGKREIVEPKVVFDLDEAQVKRMKNLRAVRDASDEEIALYEKQNASKKSATGPKAAAKKAEPEKKDGEGDDAPKSRRGRGRKVADL